MDVEALKTAYYSPKHPGSFTAVDKLYRAQKGATRPQVKKWLSGEESYTLHHPLKRKFPRLPVVVSAIHEQFDIDLIDFSHEPDQGYSYVLVAIDILSHYAWTRALESKTGRVVSRALESIFEETTPKRVRSDRGSEFKSKLTQQVFKKFGIVHFFSNNETKSSYAERLIKTLKMKLRKYETWKQKHGWKDILQDITYSYNHTWHRTIRMKPADVTVENQAEVWMRQYVDNRRPHKKYTEFKFQVGSHVRISKLRTVFERAYDQLWTGEIFVIIKRFRRGNFNLYALKDFLDEPIQGVFYEGIRGLFSHHFL